MGYAGVSLLTCVTCAPYALYVPACIPWHVVHEHMSICASIYTVWHAFVSTYVYQPGRHVHYVFCVWCLAEMYLHAYALTSCGKTETDSFQVLSCSVT